MKTYRWLACLVVTMLVFGLYTPLYAENAGKALVVADFDTGDKPNNLGGDFGAWDKDPNDESQGCQLSFARRAIPFVLIMMWTPRTPPITVFG